MKQNFPHLHLSLNGGVTSLKEAVAHLEMGMDGVMIGRSAYHQPWDILGDADALIFAKQNPFADPVEGVEAMLPYVEEHLSEGGKLGQISKHMLGLFAGQPGARLWRRVLSEGAHKEGAGVALIKEALDAVRVAREGALEAQK